jgi:histidine triad (HIT) family protein
VDAGNEKARISTQMKTACKFCQIVKGKRNAYVFYEDDHALCMLARHPRTEGQCVVIPKKHSTTLFDITETDLQQLMSSVKKISSMLQKKLGAKGVNMLHSSGEVAQQYVSHFAIHLFPRYSIEEIDIWPKSASQAEEDVQEENVEE